jgi:hypothetical protein
MNADNNKFLYLIRVYPRASAVQFRTAKRNVTADARR